MEVLSPFHIPLQDGACASNRLLFLMLTQSTLMSGRKEKISCIGPDEVSALPTLVWVESSLYKALFYINNNRQSDRFKRREGLALTLSHAGEIKMKIQSMLKKAVAVFAIASAAFTTGFASSSASADSSGATKYPIVLVHGLSGFDTLLIMDYFYGIRGALNGVGANQVYTPQIAGWESNEVRGEELLAYVQDVLAATGAAKVNLIGHSQGGPTSRYVAAVRPDLVASVTSVGSPHMGSNVADIIAESPLQGVAVDLGNAIGTLIAALSGDPSQQPNAMASLAALSSQGAADFNALYPAGLRTGACRNTPLVNVGRWWWPKWVRDYSVNDGAHQVNGVRYYSWGGTYSALFNSNPLDVFDVVLGVTSLLHNGAANDGLVARCSMHMGDNIRDDFTMNHLDEINGLFALRGLFTSAPVPIYRAHARRLKKAGL